MKKKTLKLRHVREVLFLLNLKGPISIENFSKNLNINPRTAKEDIKKLSNFFSRFSVSLSKKRGVGVYLENIDKEKKKKIQNFLLKLRKRLSLTKEDRFLKILFDCLMRENIPTIEEWSFELGVSRPIISRDVEKVKEFLEKRGVKLIGKPGSGYKISGDEKSIRGALISALLDVKKDEFSHILKLIFSKDSKEHPSLTFSLPFLEDFDVKEICNVVNSIEQSVGVKLVDKDYASFVINLLISLERIKMGKFISISPEMMFNVMKSKEFQIIYKFLNEFGENIGIKIPLEEVAYISINFISSKVREYFSTPKYGEGNIYEKYARDIVKTAENIFSLPLSGDKNLIKMLSIHLRTTLEKIKYGIRIENPLLNEMKDQYPLSYSIAERVSGILSKKLKISIPEEEIGYIAMYIAMAVEKAKHESRKRKKVAVVCATAIGTSSFLFWRLLNEMPDIDVVQVGSYKDVTEGMVDPDVDLIISTVPLPETGIPHVVVSPFLSSADRKLIREILGISKKKWSYPSSNIIEKVLDERIIFSNLEFKTSEEVIRFLGDSLVRHGYAKENFVENVIEREKKFPTGLNTPIPIALPHAGAEFTLKKGFSIATLKNSVKFKEMGNPEKEIYVRIVILPVLTENADDNAVFYEILRKIRESKIATKILNVRSGKDIKKILSKSFEVS